MAAEDSCPPLPEDVVLLHVGLHKTGTTAIQTLLAANRPALLEHGVAYPGERPEHHGPARALLQLSFGPPSARRPPPKPEVYTDFVAEVAALPGRVVVSTEYLSNVEDDIAARLVHDLGPERVHVLIGIRSLIGAAVSTWQQTLKDGQTHTIERWAELAIAREDVPPKLPRALDHGRLGALARQWADAAGADRVTMAVVEGQDRTWLPATFEQLLDLPAGLLSQQEPPLVNRGMTAAEAELVRRVNVASLKEISHAEHRRLIRFGAVRSMVEGWTPPAGEPKPALPAWAVEELQAAAAKAAEEIRASGVRVLGDLAALAAAPSTTAPQEPATALPMDAAVDALLGTVRIAAQPAPPPRPAKPANPPITAVPARTIARELRRRLWRRAAMLVARARRRAT